ncbi:MAG: hypothetical protein DCC71_18025 [Proteobacteria bacterium]|nr:MAG: hypothetical protein DCC71_18025 [Pseudomonadota bacterium]
MKAKLLLTTAIAFALTIGASANAAMIAGWDFSQYFADGALSLDGETLTDTLPANYSDLDPTFGAGAESAAYGRMYLNGQFGSAATPLDFTDPFVPSAAAGGSLLSNLNAPAGVPFDQLNVLTAEGQAFTNLQVMTALAATSVVFEADPAQLGSDWSFSFGAKTSAGSSSVGVEFSTDGASYASVGSASLTSVDTAFEFALGALASDKAYVRLTFEAPVGASQAFLDNVAFSATPVVPEPGTALLLVAGLVGLAKAGRRED